MKSERCLDVVIVGLGGVGRAFVRQLRDVCDRLNSERGIDLQLVGLADRGGVIHCREGIADSLLTEALDAKAQGKSIRVLHSAMPPAASLTDLATPRTLFVDATAAADMARIWRDVLDVGAGVVLANKLPLCEVWSQSKPLFNHPRVRYEATVGAGLPVLSTLRSLLGTGDAIVRIAGALSGTLGFLAERLSAGVLFSEALAAAVALGYVEPDPSEDLSGRDVARKAVILSRTAGWPIELGDVDLEGLIPDKQVAEMKSGGIEAWIDDALKRRFEDASRDGEMLRYLTQVSPNGLRVGLTRVPASNPFAAISGPENRVAFHTRRYPDYPLAITGPGAGPEVTAAGVLADLIALAEKRTANWESS